MDTEKWGREKARARYGSEGMKKMADGGNIKPLPMSPAAMGFPPAPDDNAARMGSARSSGSREVVEREIESFHKRNSGK